MLAKGFKIVSPKTFEIFYDDVTLNEGEALIKIEMGAVCKADLRYFLGARDKRILGLKYPMRLIHEAVGTVLKDPTGTYTTGQKVVLVPNIAHCNKDCEKKCKFYFSLGENFCPDAKFASSNIDGFSCEYISFPITNIVPVKDEVQPEKAVFAELTSVAVAAVRRCSHLTSKDEYKEPFTIGVWGDGLVGYIMMCTLESMLKEKNIDNARLVLVGKNPDKMEKFPCDKWYHIGDKHIQNENIDIAFECVGGQGSESAIGEIINVITIGGKLILTGVSEKNVEIPTRKILEKGITITGSTRSSVEDFKNAVRLIESPAYNKHLDTLIHKVVTVRNIVDYYNVFEEEADNRQLYKNLMKFDF